MFSGATGAFAGTALTAAAWAPYVLASDGSAAKTRPLPIPPLLRPRRREGTSVFRLDMRRGTHEVLPGVRSNTMGFNGSFPGPTIRVRDRERVRVEITNHLGEDTTVHWHGAHVPPDVDGGMQTTFANGNSWEPEFTVNQEAATLWYHPHSMGTSSKQIAHGLAGMMIVDDDSAASRALPHRYGVDDIPVVLQCRAVDPAGALKYDFTGYNEEGVLFPVLVNGVNVEDTTLTLRAARSRLRLRFLNASLTDVFTVSRADGRPLTQIATEAAYLPEATEVETRSAWWRPPAPRSSSTRRTPSSSKPWWRPPGSRAAAAPTPSCGSRRPTGTAGPPPSRPASTPCRASTLRPSPRAR
ncbi:multicopper oxidase family protein [Streptomyces litchfieldiae]|uniref:Multicopper oxidase domain-containing protein n=1 Tax=Streptomyces litchfieldiae TaxID=3075543 RepID=A0ABU2MHL9_9ACTN|nr:multicopper oxidase domain-containing protein [Streptomyces sp. DSM 44938]MDT0341081.1 multicopper oxidase domain-containing protein [Streptomyces sp. DSM 44938]